MGRPRRQAGDSDTRASILEAARSLFAQDGYAGTSLRSIARAAGVDAALVHHYFDDKPALFAAALDLPLDPSVIVQALLAGDPAAAGDRLATLYLSLWENDDARPRLLALVRSAATEDAAAAMMRDFLHDGILTHVAAGIGGEDAELRATLLGAQLVGVAMLRYVIRMPPLAQAAPQDVVRWLGPALQGHLGSRSQPPGGPPRRGGSRSTVPGRP
ncbi:MAG: hypothetical protein QOC60_18 [Frankiaceae bacterium]|nr:hypothetical protein [Frankiaceae bacterium]